MLIYTGGGFGGSLPLIPSRDLNDDEVTRYGGAAHLIATGLYAKPNKSRETIDLDEKSRAGKTSRAAQEEK